MNDLFQNLKRQLSSHETMAIAFSGGTDSCLLAAVAQQACGRVLAVTVDSEFQSARDKQGALDMARALGLDHGVVKVRVLENEQIRKNPSDRCYYCKKLIFKQVKNAAEQAGFQSLAHGANLDDAKDFRPGFKAAQEAGFLAPLMDAGLSKADVRNLSKTLGLATWNLPSQSCLAARIPYGDPITRETLSRIEQGESILYEKGFPSVRVRCHGRLARIELPVQDMERFMAKGGGQKMAGEFRKIGFLYTALDLEGYITGSLNRGLE